MGSVNLDGGGLRVLALAVSGELYIGAFQHFQKGLLYSFMSRVGSDGIILTGFAGNLVELVKIDDTMLGLFYVLTGGVVEIANGDLYITGLGEA